MPVVSIISSQVFKYMINNVGPPIIPSSTLRKHTQTQVISPGRADKLQCNLALPDNTSICHQKTLPSHGTAEQHTPRPSLLGGSHTCKLLPQMLLSQQAYSSKSEDVLLPTLCLLNPQNLTIQKLSPKPPTGLYLRYFVVESLFFIFFAAQLKPHRQVIQDVYISLFSSCTSLALNS